MIQSEAQSVKDLAKEMTVKLKTLLREIVREIKVKDTLGASDFEVGYACSLKWIKDELEEILDDPTTD